MKSGFTSGCFARTVAMGGTIGRWLILCSWMAWRNDSRVNLGHNCKIPKRLYLGRVVTQLSFNRVVKVMTMPYMWNMGRRARTFMSEAALPNCGWRVWVSWDTTFRWERHTWVFG